MRCAILGGTFDPVHTGHINMAKSAIEQFNLNKLILVPNGNPPHKEENSYTDFCHRYNMLKIAFSKIPNTEVSSYEASNEKRHYSVDTMRYFRTLLGEDTFFIIGADSLLSIHLWRDSETLLKENKFIVFPREDDKKLKSAIEKYREVGAKIFLSDTVHWDISSTDVRKMLKTGSLPDGMITPEVLEYIEDNSLYGGA